MVEIMDKTLKALQRRAEAAQSHYEAQEQALYRADGAPLFAPEEMRERLQGLREERTASLREIQQEARQVGEAARQEIINLEHRDPLSALTDEELTRANNRRALAMDSAESLDTPQLVRRLRSVLDGGDRGEIGAYFAAAQRARTRIIARRRDAAERNAGTAAARSGVPDMSPLDGILAEMRRQLVGQGEEAEIEAARAREHEAVAVELLASNLTVGARSAAGAWAARRRPEIGAVR